MELLHGSVMLCVDDLCKLLIFNMARSGACPGSLQHITLHWGPICFPIVNGPKNIVVKILCIRLYRICYTSFFLDHMSAGYNDVIIY